MTDLERVAHADKLLAKCLQPGALALPDAKARLPARDAPYDEHAAPDDPWAPFRVQRRLPIPAAVFETITTRTPTATLSLFPAVRRACISVDNRVYLWNYAEGSAAFEYHALPEDEVVLAVGLVPAAAGVFVPSIAHVLVLATGASALAGARVVLLGVEMLAGGGIRLYDTGMHASTNGVALRDVRGTAGGRIFAAGSDQSVYEVVYSATEGWFTPRCYLYNVSLPRLSNLVPSFFKSEKRIDCLAVDSARALLYVLRHGDQIDVYALPSRDASRAPTHTGSMYGVARQAGLLHSAAEVGHMVWLAPTEPDTRSSTCLVAVTDRGFRIYFDDLQRRSWAPLVVRAPPGAIRHVQPPAAGFFSALPASPERRTSAAFYAAGVFFVAFAGADGASQLFCTAPSTPAGTLAAPWPAAGAAAAAAGAPSASTWLEAAARIPLGTGTSAPVLAEVGTPPRGAVLRPAAAETVAPPRVFLVLDSNGLTEVVERRPADVLAALLGAGAGAGVGAAGSGALASAPPIVDFYTRVGPIEASMAALCLAAGSPHLGHAPVLAGDSAHVAVSDEVAVHALRVFFSPLASLPADARMPSALAPSKTARHEALVCYIGCAVRDVWATRILALAPPALDAALAALVPLHAFMQRHAQLFEFGRTSSARDEHSDLDALRALVTRAVQACRFVLFMHDHALPALVNALPAPARTRTSTLVFGELVASADGRSVANDLVTALIDAQSGARASVDAIAELLQARCPSFCSADDVRRLKAAECIRNAAQTDSLLRAERTLAHDASDDRRRAIDTDLQTSLSLLLASAADIALPRLAQTAATYNALGFARGTIALGLACARASDPDDLAAVFRADGYPVEASPRRTHYDTRRAMYALVLEALLKVDAEAAEAAAAAAADARRSPAADHAAAQRAAAYELATASPDVLFHEELYAWLLSRSLTDQLLELRTPWLEGFLAAAPSPVLADAVPDAARRLRDLLWQFYVRSGDYLAAAQTLDALAHSAEFALRLDERIEYLALGVGNAKSIRAAHANSVHDLISFASQLEEDLEVAQVQAKVRSALQPIDTLDMDDAERAALADTVAWLDAELLDVTTLYRDVAEPFDLLEEKLLLIHTAQYQDWDLVARIWDALLAREHAGAAGSEHAPQAIAALVTDVYVRLGRSDIACPLDLLVPMLEQYAYEHAPHVAPGWAPLVLLEGSAPADVVFDVLRGLIDTAPPPWNTTSGLGFLLPDLAAYLTAWVSAVLAQPAGSRTYFPAERVDQAANEALLKLSTNQYVRDGTDPRATTEQLQTLVQRIKRAF